MTDVKYLIVRDTDQKVIAECYDSKIVQDLALAMQDVFSKKYDIVSCDSDKRYEYLDGRGTVEEAESENSQKGDEV